MSSASTDPLYDGLQSMKEIEWANLVTLDLSEYDSPNGKQKLANQVRNAIRTSGFFSVKNFGISKEMIEQQTKLCHAFFGLPLEENVPYHDPEGRARGDISGYRPIGSGMRKINYQGRHKDNAEIYNTPRFGGFNERPQPKVLLDEVKAIENFRMEVNERVVQKVLRLFATVLELPDENQLAKTHKYTGNGEDTLRYIKYHAIPIEDSEANNGVYAAKHTDVGTLTLNFQQSVGGLQILDADKNWKWVKPWEDEIIINCGDAMSALTGGYFKSGEHRVHAPPKEQIQLDRFVVLTFSRLNNDVIMESIRDSPVLQKANLETWAGMNQGLNGEEWSRFWISHLLKQDEVELAKVANLT